MKNIRLALAAATLAFALPAAADTLEIAGTPNVQQTIEPHAAAIEASSGVQLSISAVGMGKGLLDLTQGNVAVATVIGTLDEAVAAARKQAKAEGKVFAMPAGGFKFHPVGKAFGDDRQIAFVTVGAPVPELQKVLMYLRSNAGRDMMLARR